MPAEVAAELLKNKIGLKLCTNFDYLRIWLSKLPGEREREKERERKRERERKKEREKEREREKKLSRERG